MKLTSTQRISSCGMRAPRPATSPAIRWKVSTAISSLAADFGGATWSLTKAAQLVLHLRLGRPVRLGQGAVDQVVGDGDPVLRQRHRRRRGQARGVGAGQIAEGATYAHAGPL